jgi:hypothetical protein
VIPPLVLLALVALAWWAVYCTRRITALLVAVFGTVVTIYVLAGHPHGLS